MERAALERHGIGTNERIVVIRLVDERHDTALEQHLAIFHVDQGITRVPLDGQGIVLTALRGVDRQRSVAPRDTLVVESEVRDAREQQLDIEAFAHIEALRRGDGRVAQDDDRLASFHLDPKITFLPHRTA